MMDKQYKRTEKIQYLRMKSSDFKPYRPNKVSFKLEAAQVAIYDSEMIIPFLQLSSDEMVVSAQKCAGIANEFLDKIIKG